MIFKHLLTSLLLLVAAAPASAQAPATPEEELIEFRAIGWNREIPKMFYELKGKARPLPVHRGTPTQPQRYAGPAKLTFYIPVISDGETSKQPIAEVTLNPPPQKNLVVIWQSKGGRYEAAVLADNPNIPPPGSLRFVNFSNQPLVLKCNSNAPFSLAAGAERIVVSDSGGIGVKVAMRTQKNGEWELALMNGISVEPDERVTAFIADPSRLAVAAEDENTRSSFETAILTLFLIRDRVTAK